VRNTLLNTVTLLLHFKKYIKAMEANPSARDRLIPILVDLFDERDWPAVANIWPGLWTVLCSSLLLLLSVSLFTAAEKGEREREREKWERGEVGERRRERERENRRRRRERRERRAKEEDEREREKREEG